MTAMSEPNGFGRRDGSVPPPPLSHRAWRLLGDDVLDDDPRALLVSVRQLADLLVPALERRAVALARADGWNWSSIGSLLGRSRQALRSQYGSIERAETRPLRETAETQRADRARQRERAAARWQQLIEEAERRRADDQAAG